MPPGATHRSTLQFCQKSSSRSRAIVMSSLGQRVAASMPQHVRMDEEEGSRLPKDLTNKLRQLRRAYINDAHKTCVCSRSLRRFVSERLFMVISARRIRI